MTVLPLVQISMATGRTREQKRQLLGAVSRAVEESIGAPTASIRVWIHEFEADELIAGGVILADRGAEDGTVKAK